MNEKLKEVATTASVVFGWLIAGTISVLIFNGCSTPRETSDLPDRLQIVSKELQGNNCTFYVIKDTLTNQEFLASSRGSAVLISK